MIKTLHVFSIRCVKCLTLSMETWTTKRTHAHTHTIIIKIPDLCLIINKFRTIL